MANGPMERSSASLRSSCCLVTWSPQSHSNAAHLSHVRGDAGVGTPPPSGPCRTATHLTRPLAVVTSSRVSGLRACDAPVFIATSQCTLSSSVVCAAACRQARAQGQGHRARDVAGDSVWRVSSLRDAGTAQEQKSGHWGSAGLARRSTEPAPFPRRACEAPGRLRPLSRVLAAEPSHPQGRGSASQ